MGGQCAVQTVSAKLIDNDEKDIAGVRHGICSGLECATILSATALLYSKTLMKLMGFCLMVEPFCGLTWKNSSKNGHACGNADTITS
jgi:hypothetical protein